MPIELVGIEFDKNKILANKIEDQAWDPAKVTPGDPHVTPKLPRGDPQVSAKISENQRELGELRVELASHSCA